MAIQLQQSGMNEDEDGGMLPPMAEINVTPFVDVMLVLLIIFMVAAPLMIAGVPVNLPQTAAARQNPPQKPLIITLSADARLYIRDDIIMREDLAVRLAALRQAEGDAVAYIRADKTIPYGDVMAILGEAGAAGYGRISLLSEPKIKAASAP
jgi:biopolymer transport protein TolR